MRFSAIGFTFQVSPAMCVTCSMRASHGAWKRWYIAEVKRNVTNVRCGKGAHFAGVRRGDDSPRTTRRATCSSSRT